MALKIDWMPGSRHQKRTYARLPRPGNLLARRTKGLAILLPKLGADPALHRTWPANIKQNQGTTEVSQEHVVSLICLKKMKHFNTVKNTDKKATRSKQLAKQEALSSKNRSPNLFATDL